jgi:hypothetical protein
MVHGWGEIVQAGSAHPASGAEAARPALRALVCCIVAALAMLGGCSSAPPPPPPPPKLDEAARRDAERSALAFACAVQSGNLARAQAWAAYLMGYNAGLAEEDIELSKEHAELFDTAGEELARKPLNCRGVEALPKLPTRLGSGPDSGADDVAPSDPLEKETAVFDPDGAPVTATEQPVVVE